MVLVNVTCEYVKELIEYLGFLCSGQSNISRISSDRSLSTFFMDFKKVYKELNSTTPPVALAHKCTLKFCISGQT
ncbi:hypothetical protein LXL04_018980 [Taraxacum kok-saghyz]